jgi:hypothetical protein
LVTPSTRRATSELTLHLLGREVGVLDRVVEERGGDCLSVKLEVGQDGGNLQRVVDVLLA